MFDFVITYFETLKLEVNPTNAAKIQDTIF